MKKDNKGFSLVELIIVIAIMAVLVGILAPQYLKYVNNSKVSTDITNANEIATVVNTLVADTKLTGGTTATTDVTVTLTDGDKFTSGTTDKDLILQALGTSVVTKYKSGASYIITYNIATGVSKVEYQLSGETTKYIAYPNPDDTTNGMNAKLKQ